MFRSRAPSNASSYAKKDGFFALRLDRDDICLPLPRRAWQKRLSKSFNGGCADNDGKREPRVKNFFDPCEDVGHLNRSASQVEEVILYPYGRALQHILPDAGKLSFQICSGRNVFGQHGPSLSLLIVRQKRARIFCVLMMKQELEER